MNDPADVLAEIISKVDQRMNAGWGEDAPLGCTEAYEALALIRELAKYLQ